MRTIRGDYDCYDYGGTPRFSSHTIPIFARVGCEARSVVVFLGGGLEMGVQFYGAGH